VDAVFLFMPRRWVGKSANFAGYFLPLRAFDSAVPKLAAPSILNCAVSKVHVTLLSHLLWPLSLYRRGCAAPKNIKKCH
jgi:hypothetical protein